MLIHKEVNTSVSVLAGAWSDNTKNIAGGVLMQIIVQATNSTTTFDFRLTDEDGIIQQWPRNRDELIKELYLPVRGKYTMALANVSNDETFKVKLMIDETN